MKERAVLLKQRASTRGEEPSPASAIHLAAAPVGFWSRLTARIRAWFEVPTGYEDESGFHYGQQPMPTQAQTVTEDTAFRAKVHTDRADHAIKHAVVLPTATPPEQSDVPVSPEQKPETAHD